MKYRPSILQLDLSRVDPKIEQATKSIGHAALPPFSTIMQERLICASQAMRIGSGVNEKSNHVDALIITCLADDVIESDWMGIVIRIGTLGQNFGDPRCRHTAKDGST